VLGAILQLRQGAVELLDLHLLLLLRANRWVALSYHSLSTHDVRMHFQHIFAQSRSLDNVWRLGKLCLPEIVIIFVVLFQKICQNRLRLEVLLDRKLTLRSYKCHTARSFINLLRPKLHSFLILRLIVALYQGRIIYDILFVLLLDHSDESWRRIRWIHFILRLLFDAGLHGALHLYVIV
jgi:hypothetical protein